MFTMCNAALTHSEMDNYRFRSGRVRVRVRDRVRVRFRSPI